MSSPLRAVAVALTALGLGCLASSARTIKITDYGAVPNSGKDATPAVLKALATVRNEHDAVLQFPKGTYEFWPEQAHHGLYFISNHDHQDSLAVAIPIQAADGFTLDGQGSTFICHGILLPVAILNSSRVILRDFTVDYVSPHILVTKVLSSSPALTRLEALPNQNYVVEGQQIFLRDGAWKQVARAGLELDPQTMAVALKTGDYWRFSANKVTETSPGIFDVVGLPSPPKPGNLYTLRNTDRPAPAIWASESRDLAVDHITIRSALGTAFLAQKSQDIHLDHFDVALASGRYLTTNADAVHFSNCKGKLLVENGLYENMLDDGINVHGSYLHVMKRTGPRTLLLEWGHPQTFGFTFAAVGEHVEFVEPRAMQPTAHATVAAITRPDDHHLLLTLDAPLSNDIHEGDFVDNLDWRPSIIYRNNTVRRIRARAVLFSTTAGVLIENNHFDKTTLAAILIPGEAKDWYESTPSSDVTIRHNIISDSNLAQPHNGAITIGPTIAPPLATDGYNHRHFVIEDNQFSLLDQHMLQALSLDGLVFLHNTLTQSTDYPYVRGEPAFSFVHSRCIDIEATSQPSPLTPQDVSEQDSKLIHIDTYPASAPLHDLRSACVTH